LSAIALSATAIVVLALLWELTIPWFDRRHKARMHRRARGGSAIAYDPGRERRAEQRARELLRSCVNDEEWAMYRDLGFIRVWGGEGQRAATLGRRLQGLDYAYLIYPHKPIVAYLTQTNELLNEYCVEFPDETRPYGSDRLPASDDVLAKWMGLRADERRIITEANLHVPGRQVDPRQVERDLWRLRQWERARIARAGSEDDPSHSRPAGTIDG
jgi:hypothetical protein